MFPKPPHPTCHIPYYVHPTPHIPKHAHPVSHKAYLPHPTTCLQHTCRNVERRHTLRMPPHRRTWQAAWGLSSTMPPSQPSRPLTGQAPPRYSWQCCGSRTPRTTGSWTPKPPSTGSRRVWHTANRTGRPLSVGDTLRRTGEGSAASLCNSAPALLHALQARYAAEEAPYLNQVRATCPGGVSEPDTALHLHHSPDEDLELGEIRVFMEGGCEAPTRPQRPSRCTMERDPLPRTWSCATPPPGNLPSTPPPRRPPTCRAARPTRSCPPHSPGWHRDGYLANRVPPLTGSGSAQVSSKGIEPMQGAVAQPNSFCPHTTAMCSHYIHLVKHTGSLVDGAQAKRGVGGLGEVGCALVGVQRHVPKRKHHGLQRRWSLVRTPHSPGRGAPTTEDKPCGRSTRAPPCSSSSSQHAGEQTRSLGPPQLTSTGRRTGRHPCPPPPPPLPGPPSQGRGAHLLAETRLHRHMPWATICTFLARGTLL